ncbi:hypothetical protein GCM10011379_18200 [Filimonas zeae]|uniref:PKD domain-containing protein n=2 Tax=Filimonas zeae TaxID=1737353 RepID=A0A917IVU1_9BACT|nr:hypothetical protein GCM10011379_18200 [Filimonas zeae]
MESAVDCIGESFFVSLKTVANADNPKIVNLEVHYSGSHTFTSVNWTYGDGATAESTTTSTQHTHYRRQLHGKSFRQHPEKRKYLHQ